MKYSNLPTATKLCKEIETLQKTLQEMEGGVVQIMNSTARWEVITTHTITDRDDPITQLSRVYIADVKAELQAQIEKLEKELEEM